MGLRAYAAPFWSRTPATIGVLAALAGCLLAGCEKAPGASATTSDGTPSDITATTSAASPSAAPPSRAGGKGSGDWCALAEWISVESGVMVNKHFIPLQEETLDMFKAVVHLSLANREALLVGIPNDVKAAVLIEEQYYQSLQDSNFSSAAKLPAGWQAAHEVLVKYEVEHCGFVYDK